MRGIAYSRPLCRALLSMSCWTSGPRRYVSSYAEDCGPAPGGRRRALRATSEA
jgi:hypothetical protein